MREECYSNKVQQWQWKSYRFAASFRWINRLVSAFFTLQWYKPAHVCDEVTTVVYAKMTELKRLANLFFEIENQLRAEICIRSPKILFKWTSQSELNGIPRTFENNPSCFRLQHIFKASAS